MLKGNGYQERNFGKIFERTDNNQRLSQSQQQPQVTDIQEQEMKMNINLPYVEGTTEKLWLILRPHKIRSIFYTESTLRKLLYKPTDLLAREDKKNDVCERHCSNCEAVYFGESKRSPKARLNKHIFHLMKRSFRNSDYDKNETAKHCWEGDHNFYWDQMKVDDRAIRLIPRKIKETIHSLKNPNHINKIFFMLPEIWIPNLR